MFINDVSKTPPLLTFNKIILIPFSFNFWGSLRMLDSTSELTRFLEKFKIQIPNLNFISHSISAILLLQHYCIQILSFKTWHKNRKICKIWCKWMHFPIIASHMHSLYIVHNCPNVSLTGTIKYNHYANMCYNNIKLLQSN